MNVTPSRADDDGDNDENRTMTEILSVWRELTALTQLIGKDAVTYRTMKLHDKRKKDHDARAARKRNTKEEEAQNGVPTTRKRGRKMHQQNNRQGAPQESTNGCQRQNPRKLDANRVLDGSIQQDGQTHDDESVENLAISPSLVHPSVENQQGTSQDSTPTSGNSSLEDTKDTIELIKIHSMKKQLADLLGMQMWFHRELSRLPPRIVSQEDSLESTASQNEIGGDEEKGDEEKGDGKAKEAQE